MNDSSMEVTQSEAQPEIQAEETRRRRGRPRGPHVPTQVNPVEVSRCPLCGSTSRSAYSHTRTLEHGGVTREGREYTHVVWRRTRCESCGQYRDDKAFEMRAAPDGNEPRDDEQDEQGNQDGGQGDATST